MGELRCDSKLHGISLADNVIEIACSSRFCGASSDTVVLHEFDLSTNEMIRTKRYKKPRRT